MEQGPHGAGAEQVKLLIDTIGHLTEHLELDASLSPVQGLRISLMNEQSLKAKDKEVAAANEARACPFCPARPF